MKPRNETPLHDWIEAHIESYVDGELSVEERIEFDHLIASDPLCREQVLLASQIKKTLVDLSAPPCPPHVTRSIMVRQRQAVLREIRTSLLSHVRKVWITTWQPALSMTFLVLLVVSAALFGNLPQGSSEQDEVRQAMKDVEWTLAYLSEIGRKTSTSLKEDIFHDHVVTSMQQAVGVVFNEHSDDQIQR